MGGGWFTMPLITWIVFPSGLGVSIAGMGKVFIHASEYTFFRYGKWIIRSGCWLEHSSPELNGPVFIPGNDIIKELCMQQVVDVPAVKNPFVSVYSKNEQDNYTSR